MSSLQAEAPRPRALAIDVTDDVLTVWLVDGRSISVPLRWYPRLQQATPAERENAQVVGAGEGLHWPDLDEDVSVESLLAGRGSGESASSLGRWLGGRGPGQ